MARVKVKETNDLSPSPSNGEAGPASGKERSTGVQSLERAFGLLEEIAKHRDGISHSDLAKSCSLHNSTAFHLVKTLVNLGYVRQGRDSKRYYIGRMVYGLAANSLDEMELVGIAEPLLEDLARQTGEGTHLGMRSGSDVIIAARCEAPSVFQLSVRSRGLRPPHCTALGKILLSELPEKELDLLLRNHQFKAYTSKTITDPERFRRELDSARTNNVAFDDCEFSDEMRCIAVPVREFTGQIVAAIGLSGPVWRLNVQALHEMAPKVQEVARLLSRELGHNDLGSRLTLPSSVRSL